MLKMQRVVGIVEARTITGPAKNVIRFATQNRDVLDFHFVTYARTKSEQEATAHSNDFIDTCRQNSLPVSVIWEQTRFDTHVLNRLAECLRALRPQIVQTHSVKSHFLFALIRKRIEARWIAFHHGYTAEDLKMRTFNQLDRFSLPRAHQVVTVCEAFKRDLLDYQIAPDRIHVLHNSLDPAWGQRAGLDRDASAIRSTLPGHGVAPVLLCVGRLSKEKGHAILLEAVVRLRAALKRPELPIPFALVLVGDGPERASLEEQIRVHQLESLVVLAGQRRDVRPYFAAADLLVLPSLSEGSPNVLLEAMAAKLPIVTTNAGGVREIVSNAETALIVPLNNPAEIAAALQYLIENPGVRNGIATRAYERLNEHFSPASYNRKLLCVYEAALQHGATTVLNQDASQAMGNAVLTGNGKSSN